MSKIFELFGYPITDTSQFVADSRKQILCPFISEKCDGGGNRYMSEIDLSINYELADKFPGLDKIPSGICSIQLSDDTPPWIICPRRLLYMGKKASKNILTGETQSVLLSNCGFIQKNIGIWSEIKVKYFTNELDDNRAFDYTFDYVIMPIGRVSKDEAVDATGIEWGELYKILNNSGHAFSQYNNKIFVEDFPIDCPVIVEVMTSSTSGGNKNKRTCIPLAFEDYMLGKNHNAPGINYRQVWARMASQLIVKSQVAMAWGGKTIWILQDLLADYISSSTALNLSNFISSHTDEVNILAFSYDNSLKQNNFTRIVPLSSSTLYSGSIRASDDEEVRPCFQDILLASVCPPRNVLITALCKKEMANQLTVV